MEHWWNDIDGWTAVCRDLSQRRFLRNKFHRDWPVPELRNSWRKVF